VGRKKKRKSEKDEFVSQGGEARGTFGPGRRASMSTATDADSFHYTQLCLGKRRGGRITSNWVKPEERGGEWNEPSRKQGSDELQGGG